MVAPSPPSLHSGRSELPSPSTTVLTEDVLFSRAEKKMSYLSLPTTPLMNKNWVKLSQLGVWRRMWPGFV